MSWEFLDSVPDIKGPYSYSTDGATTWESALNTANSSGLFYELSNRGNTFNYVSGNNSYSYDVDGSNKNVSTSFGATIRFRASNPNGSSGAFEFITNWTPPGKSGVFAPGIAGLMANACFRIVVNHDLEESEIFLLRSFYNQPWFTCVNGIMYYNQSDRQYFYQYIMGKIFRWQSVLSITGKGKTVQLSTLNDVNNGEEVITDDTSKFNLTTASNLVTLVQK